MHKNHPRNINISGVIRNCHSSVLQVAWSALNHLAPQCVAMNDCRWLYAFDLGLFPLDGYSFAAPSFQLHPVFGAASSRVPPGDTMSRFVGFGDKSWDNSKNFFQTQGFEFLFLSQRARRDAFASSISPKTPVLKLNRPFARKPPATIASELTRAAFMLVEKPQVAALRRPRVK